MATDYLAPLQISIKMDSSHSFDREYVVKAGFKPYEHQVGGHRFEEGKNGLLQCPQGHILKPLPPGVRGDCERIFYQNVFFSDDPEYQEIKPCLPCCLGFQEVTQNANKTRVPYVILENIIEHYNKPCILDIKIGRNTSDQFASVEKRRIERAKYPLQEELGFRIIGIKVYNKVTGKYTFRNRYFGRNLMTPESVMNALHSFFYDGEKTRTDAIQLVIARLEKIEHWFSTQTKISCVSSSVLIVYDSEPTLSLYQTLNNTVAKCTCDLETSCAKSQVSQTNIKCDVRMIDFAHIYEQKGQFKIDENYLYGIKSLLSYLKKWV